MIQNIYKVLKPQGILVYEFGADGNIATIENAFASACKETGYDYKSKFNFSTTENFSKLLEKNGFLIDMIYDYDRPTPLKEAKKGLANWMKQVFASELEAMPKNIQVIVIKQEEELTRKTFWNGNEWVADYRRIRVVAHI